MTTLLENRVYPQSGNAGREIFRFTTEVDCLPPSLKVVPRLLALLDESSHAGSDSILEVIRVDPALLTAILKVCNSVSFSGICRTGTLQEAVFRLGLKEVYRVVMKVIAVPLMNRRKYGLSLSNLWNHSLAVAVAAQMLARDRGENMEMAYTAGLLHDVGKIVISEWGPESYRKLIAESNEKQLPLSILERQRFEIDHAELGAELLSTWNFPESIVSAVRFHHAATFAENQRLSSILHLSNLLAAYIDQGAGHPYSGSLSEDNSFALLGMTLQDLEEYVPQLHENFNNEIAPFSRSLYA